MRGLNKRGLIFLTATLKLPDLIFMEYIEENKRIQSFSLANNTIHSNIKKKYEFIFLIIKILLLYQKHQCWYI